MTLPRSWTKSSLLLLFPFDARLVIQPSHGTASATADGAANVGADVAVAAVPTVPAPVLDGLLGRTMFDPFALSLDLLLRDRGSVQFVMFLLYLSISCISCCVELRGRENTLPFHPDKVRCGEPRTRLLDPLGHGALLSHASVVPRSHCSRCLR